jgi:hypothetical protein
MLGDMVWRMTHEIEQDYADSGGGVRKAAEKTVSAAGEIEQGGSRVGFLEGDEVMDMGEIGGNRVPRVGGGPGLIANGIGGGGGKPVGATTDDMVVGWGSVKPW